MSTDSSDQLESYKAQVAYYTDAIAKNPKWRFAGIYADEGLSGTQAAKRDDFLRMIKDCEKGKIDYIITKSVARFARNTVDALKYVRKLKALGIGVYFEEQCLDSLKSESELALGIYSVLAQAESENISANVRWGIQRRMQSGTFKFRYNLIGYRKGEDGQPEIVPEEAKYVKDVFDMYLDGNSVDQIKEYLDSAPIKTATGNDIWSRNAIRNILTNERYVGDMLLQKTYIENCITKRARKNRGEMPKYLVSNNHPAIIDRDTFKQVQAEMAKRRSRPRVSDKTITAKGKFSGKYPFSDLLVCDSCGNRYRRCMWISGGKKKIVWRCITRIEHGGKACESISVGDELIHKAVYRSINRYIQNNSGALDIVLSELSKQFGGNDYTDDLCNIERSINELNKQMEDAAMIEVTTQGNKERIREEIIELSQRIVALRNEKSIIEEKMATAKTRNEELSMFSKELSLYNADCSEITDNKLRRIIQEVRIKKDHTIIIELKNGMLLEEALEPYRN